MSGLPVRDLRSTHETFRIGHRASIGIRFREVAGSAQIVFDKATIREFAIDKPTIGKATTTKDAARKSAIDEIGSGEQAPVPIHIGKRASYEIGANDLSINRKVPKLTQFEVVFVPLNSGEIALVNGL